MKNTDQYLRSLLKRTINETLEGKMESLKTDMGEGFDSPEIKFDRKGKDFDKDEFKKMRLRPYEFEKDYDLDSTTEDEFKYRLNTRDINLDDELYGDDEDLDPFIDGEDDDIEPISEGEMCEQCGSGSITEGECNECGYKRMDEGIYDVSGKFPKKQSFDYVEEEDDFDFDEEEDNLPSDEDILDRHCKSDNIEDKIICQDRKEMRKKMRQEMTEKLHGGQKMLDKNKNNKIDSEDFKLLRKSKNEVTEKWKVRGTVEEKEMEEGNEFTGELAKARKEGKKEFEVDGKSYKVKESIEYHITDNLGDTIKLTENEIISFIENIVNEQKKSGLKTIGKPKGLTTYEKAHKGSGKENDDYLKSVNKKMKDYLKDGSKGDYSMEPKMFPQGNGQLAKMSKKAYVPSNAVQDYIDNFTAAGLENLDYDGIEPNEDWVSDLVKGSSRTGNNPKWANAVETGVNTKRDTIRKDNLLGKAKKKAYNKAPQPIVTDKTGEDEGDKILKQLESIEPKKSKQINEEFDRIKELLKYDRKTQ
jgi:hypothetical protein